MSQGKRADNKGRASPALNTKAARPPFRAQKRVPRVAAFMDTFDQHSAIMMLLDPVTGAIVRANRAAEEFYGYSAQEFSRLTIYDINTQERREVERSLVDALTRTQNVFLFRHRLSSGEVCDVDVRSSPIQNGLAGLLLSVITDVSDLHRVGEALRKSEARLRATSDYADLGVSETDLDGRFLRVNDTLCEMVGYSRAELLSMTFMDLTHPDDLEEDLEHTRDLLAGRLRSFSMEKRYRRKNGLLLWVSVSISLIRDENGRPLYIIAVVQDIQQKKQIGNALARRVNELEMLYENGIATSMLLDPRQIARQLISLMDKKMHWHHVAIRQYHPSTGQLEILALNIPNYDETQILREEKRLNHLIRRPNTGLSGWVIQTGQAINTGALEEDPRYVDTYPGLKSGLYVPMKVGERVIGSIAVERETPNAFDESDKRLLVTLAAQAAVSIENARLFLEARKRAAEFEVLYETTRDLMNFTDFRALLDAITERAARLLNISGAGIYLFDSEEGELELVSLSDGDFQPGLRLKMGEGLSGRVAESRQPFSVCDYQNWEFRSPKLEGSDYRSVLGVPMLYRGELIGVLNVFDLYEDDLSAEPRIFDEADIRLVSRFAGAAAGAVYGTRLFEQANRRVEELGAIARVSSALRAASTRAQMLPVILDQLLDLLPADGAFLAFAQPPNDDLLIELARGSLSDLTGRLLPGGKGLGGQALALRQLLVSANTQEEESFLRILSAEKARAVMVSPLMAQERVMGVLAVGRDLRADGSAPQPFSEPKQRLLISVADMAASALHRAALHEQTALHADQMAAVSRLGRLLAESLNLDAIYIRLAQGIYDLLPDVCGLFISLYDAETQLIRCAYGHMDGASVDPSQLQPVRFNPGGDGKQSRVIETRQPLIIDLLEPPTGAVRQFVGDPGRAAQSALYVPMLVDGRIIGLIQVMSYTPARFGSRDTELLSVVANTAAVEIENARLIDGFERHVQRLTALHAIDAAINSSTDLRLSLRVALEQAIHLLGVDAASVLLLNPITLNLEFIVGSGFHFAKSSHAAVRLGDGLAGRAALQRGMVQSSNPKEIAACFTAARFEREHFEGYAALPLVSKGKVSGVLQVFSRAPLETSQEWTDFLYVLADQVSLAINNASLFEELERANMELSMAYDATIEGWSRALDLRDKETEGHTQRVTELTLRLANAMGIPNEEIPHIRRGALLHDIGKMGVPDEILRKPGPLTDEEWRIMREHPRLAYDLLSPIIYLRPALDVPYCHHEKWDGSGYPRGLKGEAIPLAARLFAVVDVYDALTSDRPYRPAWTSAQALALIQEKSGQHFDPRVVEAFLNIIREQPSAP